MPRIMHSTLRWPTRSPMRPNIGATSVPVNCSTPNTVSSTTDPVSTSTYQPRISVSISKAQEVARSAGHWKRKPRTRKGAKAGGPGGRLKPRCTVRWPRQCGCPRGGGRSWALLPVCSRPCRPRLSRHATRRRHAGHHPRLARASTLTFLACAVCANEPGHGGLLAVLRPAQGIGFELVVENGGVGAGGEELRRSLGETALGADVQGRRVARVEHALGVDIGAVVDQPAHRPP